MISWNINFDKKDFYYQDQKFSKENVEFSIKTLVLQFVSKYIIEFVLVTFLYYLCFMCLL